MFSDPAQWDRINSFALVAYRPDPPAGFLDWLRDELVPNCFLRAHVTILPPRAISSKPEAAWETVRNVAARFAPFDVELTQVDVFPVTDVIYVEVGRGREQMERLHEAMNVDGLQFAEPFTYHPHVTLAQDLKSDEVDELARVARSRWAEAAVPKTFRVDKLYFVQNTRRKQWIDLGECSLGHAESRLVGELIDLLAS